ncbi:hypothetical protein BH23GEM3_BH23GEM3_25730 [soil metagenome]
MRIRSFTAPLLLVLVVAGCASSLLSRPALAPEQQAFFAELRGLCGESFGGTAVEAHPGDTVYTGSRMVMQVRDCTDDQVVIPVQVGEDRSRTWIVSRGEAGLRLTHIHRHADGTEDENSRYGGTTLTPGETWRQDFPADTFSVRMVPGRATQSWTMELRPGDSFDYSLHRTATGLRYRFRFDLARPQP